MDVWELNPGGMGSLLLKASATWGWGSKRERVRKDSRRAERERTKLGGMGKREAVCI
jgi:hypothetical protein